MWFYGASHRVCDAASSPPALCSTATAATRPPGYKHLTSCLTSSPRRTAHHERATATSIGAPLFIV
jgi:hypothetical protein